ncbi:NUDIX hydrolase [Micromonospora aurantiaca (nom. illeg.)]|uniref:NUDIX hydrolase n=1 Tax=Micromonospora aurantiaca (nom. illeg.) TaxID=47850 RepID=UPI0033F6C711
MSPHGPWIRRGGELRHATARFLVHRDRVTRPDGADGTYDWVDTADLVRVAAIDAGTILLIRQHHYLVGETWQCPGGAIDDGESSLQAARRELAEETGYHHGTWTPVGVWHPLPGLTPAKVHLWQAHNLTAGPAHPEPGEADLSVLRVGLADAVEAVHQGRVGCAASAALILLAAHDTGPTRTTRTHRRAGMGVMRRRRATALRQQAAWQVFLYVQTGLWRILVDGEFTADEAEAEIGTLRDRLQRCAPHLQDTAPHILARISTAIRLIEETRHHAQRAAERAAVDTVRHLGLRDTDLPRLTSHLVVTAADLDIHHADVHDAAVSIVGAATGAVACDAQRHQAAVVGVEQCLRTIDAVNAPLQARALTLLDTALEDLTRIFDLPIDHRSLHAASGRTGTS